MTFLFFPMGFCRLMASRINRFGNAADNRAQRA